MTDKAETEQLVKMSETYGKMMVTSTISCLFTSCDVFLVQFAS